MDHSGYYITYRYSSLTLVNVYPKAQLVGVAGSILTCYKTDQVSGWSVVAPCRDTEDACIIFGWHISTIDIDIYQVFTERVERRIPEKTRQGLCAGVAACDISEMSKIFQGCINTSQFRAQVLPLTSFIISFSFSFYSLGLRMWQSTLVWIIYLILEHQRFLKDLLVFAILMGKTIRHQKNLHRDNSTGS